MVKRLPNMPQLCPTQDDATREFVAIQARKTMTETIELYGLSAQKQQVTLPRGWHRVTTGAASRGDKWWRWNDCSWQPVEDSHSFLGTAVSLLQCVIRKGSGS